LPKPFFENAGSRGEKALDAPLYRAASNDADNVGHRNDHRLAPAQRLVAKFAAAMPLLEIESHAQLGNMLDSMTFYTIKEAVRRGDRLKLHLPDGEHIVEPHVLGRDRRGRTLLRAYHVRGPRGATTSGAWKVIDVGTVLRAVEIGQRFSTPRPGHNPDHPRMSGGVIESY